MNCTSLLEQIMHGDLDACGILCDYIQDTRERPCAAHLARIYAGNPPLHEDGMPRRWLANVLEAVGVKEDAEAVRKATYQGARAIELLSTFSGDLIGLPIAQMSAFVDFMAGEPMPVLQRKYNLPLAFLNRVRDVFGAYDRDLKRRILSLPYFAKVQIEQRAEFVAQYWDVGPVARDELLRNRGFVPNTPWGERLYQWGSRGLASPPYITLTRTGEGGVNAGMVTLCQRLTASQLVWRERRTTHTTQVVVDDHVFAGQLVGSDTRPGAVQDHIGPMRNGFLLLGRAQDNTRRGQIVDVVPVNAAPPPRPFENRDALCWVRCSEAPIAVLGTRLVIPCQCSVGYAVGYFMNDLPLPQRNIESVTLDMVRWRSAFPPHIEDRYFVGVCPRCRTGFWCEAVLSERSL